jgi:CBS domain-containing protein
MLAAVAGDAALGRGRASAARHSPPEYSYENRVADVMVRFPKTHGAGSRLAQVRALFQDDHVHMVLIVAIDGLLITTIERPDLDGALPGSVLARELGTLAGRTAGPADPLDAATAALVRKRRRRLAVVDDSGRLVGLLCLKKDGIGYCSDEGIRERAQPAAGGT